MNKLYCMLWGLLSLGIWGGCQEAPPKVPTVAEEAPTPSETEVRDTLRLKEGRLPEDWHRVDLGEGYYIGFPKEPRRQHSRSQRRTEYLLKRNKYRFHLAITDLSNLESFQNHNAYRAAYYDAVLQDLAETIDADVQTPETFYSQGIYEGMRALLVAEEMRFYIQCLIIESRLYTASFLIYGEEKSAYRQSKDRFFSSFGNEYYNDPGERPDSTL